MLWLPVAVALGMLLGTDLSAILGARWCCARPIKRSCA